MLNSAQIYKFVSCFVIGVCLSLKLSAQTSCELPYFASWNTGQVPGGYGLEYQLGLLKNNRRIAPWLALPPPDESFLLSNYSTAVSEFKARKLPLTFVSTQWESMLTKDPYYSKKDDTNPNVLPLIGSMQKKVSPFGSEQYWYEVGYKWTSRATLARLQELYPDPPFVIFLSNNEQIKLLWYQLELDARYSKQFSTMQNLLDTNVKKQIAIDRWKKLYQALHQGMRDGLTNETWKQRAIFVGYLAHGSAQFGRNNFWDFQTLNTNSVIDPYASFWDGGSYSFYSKDDLTLVRNNPEIEAMNWPFMIAEDKKVNPNYFIDLSIWDGHSYDDTDTRRIQEAKEPGLSLKTYAAMSKFGMWLIRPRIVREFRFYNETVAQNEDYTNQILNIVSELNNSTVLKEFWCNGELVPNRTRQHPYNSNIPSSFANVDRWFLLNTSLDEAGQWTTLTHVRVFAIALKTGIAPKRKWLLYAHATDSSVSTVEIEIPDYKKVKLQTKLDGSYFIVDEQSSDVSDLSKSQPTPPEILKVSP